MSQQLLTNQTQAVTSFYSIYLASLCFGYLVIFFRGHRQIAQIRELFRRIIHIFLFNLFFLLDVRHIHGGM